MKVIQMKIRKNQIVASEALAVEVQDHHQVPVAVNQKVNRALEKAKTKAKIKAKERAKEKEAAKTVMIK